MRSLLLTIAAAGAALMAGCQSGAVSPPTTQPAPIQDAQTAVNDAQLILDGVETGLTIDEALGGVKHQSTLDKIAADEQAAQAIITAADTAIASGSFNLGVFESSFAAAVRTYQQDIAAAKGTN